MSLLLAQAEQAPMNWPACVALCIFSLCVAATLIAWAKWGAPL